MSNWISICQSNDLTPGVGICALHRNEQVAIFRMARDGELYAISNFDPFGQANVLSRGITGSIGDAKVVSSPLYKQHFNLQTGDCLEDEGTSVKVYTVREQNGEIQLAV